MNSQYSTAFRPQNSWTSISSSYAGRTNGPIRMPSAVPKPAVEKSMGSKSATEDIKPIVMDESLFPTLPKDEDINLEDIVFDCLYYHDKYDDVRAACGRDKTLLREHWMNKGIDEGKMCSPVLDLAFFITRIPAHLQTRQLNFRTAYKYFLQVVCDPKRADKQLASSKLYDPHVYVKRYPQLEKYTPKQLIFHYISIGRFHKMKAC